MHAPFIEDDVASFSGIARVRWLRGSGLRQILRIGMRLPASDLVFCWFASVYSAFSVWLARRLHIASIVVVGGVDVAKMEEIGYGVWTHPFRAFCAGYALRNATRVLVVDPSLIPEVQQRASYAGRNISAVATGYDGNFWRPLGPKEEIILTVAGVEDLPRLRVKGINLLLAAASAFPGYTFVIVGVRESLLRSFEIPSNVQILPALVREQLLPYYQRARIYCQPSLREGLSNALCEAMLCECIPVATDVGGTRNAIGDSGVVIAEGSIPALERGLSNAIGLPASNGRQARGRIISLFPKERREKELFRLVEEFTQ
jgi:glycosyltransferase involved in cell wall biosynthesis